MVVHLELILLQPSFNMDSNRPSFNTPFSKSCSQSPLNSAWFSTPTKPAPSSAAGRKRSREEAALNVEQDYFPVQPPAVQPEPENEEEWEYGEGMTLIKPSRSGYIIEASSQTGTWAEEKAEEEKAKALASAVAQRPILRANKSQRLDLSATPVIAEEVSTAVYPSPGSPERYTEPTVDDFTRHLGIGWSSVNSLDVDIQAAARGWAKFIENHYPISAVKIRLQSKGLASYLVEANEGYFLFGEDLKQGRLVSTSLEKTWVNLSSPVPVFDGEMVMEAGQTPKTEAVPVINGSHVMNGVQGAGGSPNGTVEFGPDGTHVINNPTAVATGEPPATLEVEMDMS
jgi:hypothetical protein